MKKLMLLAAGIVALVAFAGCATVTVTPAQIATALCAPTNTAIVDYKAFAALYPTLSAVQSANAILTKYEPVVDAVCAEGATVTATNAQDLITQGIPAVAAIVATVPLPTATQTAIQTAFAAAELLVNLAGTYENALSSAETSASTGASADAVVAAAKMSVKAPQ